MYSSKTFDDIFDIINDYRCDGYMYNEETKEEYIDSDDSMEVAAIHNFTLFINQIMNDDFHEYCDEEDYLCKACSINYYNNILNNCNEVIFDKYDDVCPICIDDMKKKEKIIKLECGHLFHKNCIYAYIFNNILNNKTILCPLCRHSL